MAEKSKIDHDRAQESIRDKAESVFGDLDFLDELPDPPERANVPFPYGKEEPRPYGWFYR